jgi:hypothetical protein
VEYLRVAQLLGGTALCKLAVLLQGLSLGISWLSRVLLNSVTTTGCSCRMHAVYTFDTDEVNLSLRLIKNHP